MSPDLLRTLFGDPTETLEDRGDELRLNGFYREAAWYYRQALERSGVRPARREALTVKYAECHATAFRQMLDEAESMEHRGRHREALALLTEAERFAEGSDEVTVAQGCRQSLSQRLALPASAGGRPSYRVIPPAGRRALPAAPFDEGATLDPALPPDPGALSDGGSEAGGWPGASTGRDPGAAVSREVASAQGAAPSTGSAVGAGAAHGEPGPFRPEAFPLARIVADPQTAIERLTEETRRHPESAMAHELLAEALRAAGRASEARAQFEAAYRRDPGRLRLVVESARLLRDPLNDPAGALLRLEQGCRRHRPTSASLVLHLERLFLLSRLERYDEALAGFAELLSVSGLERGVIHFNRAGVLEQAGQPEAARAELEAAVLVAPENVLYRERLADLCVRQQESLELGLRHLDLAVELLSHDFSRPRRGAFAPDRARLQYKAARILYLLERDAEAARRIEAALVVCLDPRVQEALLELRRELGG